MKTILVLLTSIFFAGVSFGQNNCFENCMTNFDKNSKAISDSNGFPNIEKVIESSQKILDDLIGCKFPDFDAKTITGKPLSLNSFKGKVLVINFCYSSCTPCESIVPALNKLVDDYKNKDVSFLAFWRYDKEDAINFLKKTGFKYDVIADYPDQERLFCLIGGWPENMVVDQNGIVRFIRTGGFTDERAKTQAYDYLKPIIDKYLKIK